MQFLNSIPAFRCQSNLKEYIKTLCINHCVNEAQRKMKERGPFVSTLTPNEAGDLVEMDFEISAKEIQYEWACSQNVEMP